ncbi:hypothetical protein BCU85_23190 [Vibrio lentus]|uniref:hypothetical protein n=1 Tax=Vibrio lentus TaxID=136468 RepID=UPI000C851ED7|nr:hypothetical protein [Vibrio lentus]MCC4815571.1 hypothetical protein [Vibrio lentus]PMG70889.1 hypothetical protein BCU85_23190 [Vibrio lentus]PMK89171.1 hypothetical protein BCT88_23830 [Vibrio lentus]PML24083.1 hypothetical protein BCT80_22880 [Vibrio lentus]PMM26073.1 hypothetical protein BCT57_05425 [Vibrio lentus]
MFSLESNLIPETWGNAKPRLCKALGDYLKQAEIEVQEGRESLYRVEDTYMLLRGEQSQSGSKELVVVALAGDMAAGTLSAINHGKANGFNSIRAHFSKRGAHRYIQRKLRLPVREVETHKNEHVLQIRFDDMGGKSSSRSDAKTVTTTTNKSNSQGIGGDNNGFALSGIENSDINLSMTDHGAMAVAGRTAEEAFKFGTDALDFSADTVNASLGFGESALDANANLSEHAIDSIKSMAGQQTETTKAALAIAGAAKAREQTGENESNNELLKNVSLIVGILVSLLTMAYMFAGRKQ